MLKTIMADGLAERQFIKELKARQTETDRQVTEQVAAILADVQKDGDEALKAYTLKFDKALPPSWEVPAEDMAQALAAADKEFVASLRRAADNIAAFHKRQVRQSFIHTEENGVILGQQVRGLKRVGLYVPGGTASYPSSVLMNAIPAKIAGVEELIMVTPPAKNGHANPDILVAAAIAGVDRIFLMGGAQAVAALAYGTKTVPQVDKIVGPGNIYVATAKKLLYGVVDIDMIAGPSEILIVADESANPRYLAADLMSQAEHDVLAGAVLLTTSVSQAEAVTAEIIRQIATLKRKDIITKSLERYGAIVVFSEISEMLSFADEIAPEHLEIMLANPLEYIGQIHNAGSVFLGEYAPEPLGDYYAGPNHVLPTGGTARFFSPLSVDSFVKKYSFTYYTRQALAQGKDDIIRIAQREGLTAHANSIEVRF